MTVEDIQVIIEYLKELITPLSTATYEILINQVRVKSIYAVLNIAIFLILAVITIRFIKREGFFIDESYADPDTGVFLAGIVTAHGITAIFSIAYLINAVINPDWLVIELLKEMIK